MVHDRLRRKLICHAEIPRLSLRYLTHNRDIPAKTRMLAQLKLNEMPASSSMTRLVCRCILTGRSRGIIPEYNISRMKFREMALAGLIPNVTKSSW